MIETIPNDYGRIAIQVQEAIGFTCLGGPSKTKITVYYTPDKILLELISFHDWCSTNFINQEAQPLESIVDKVSETLVDLLHPRFLSVTGESIIAGVHGPVKVVKTAPLGG